MKSLHKILNENKCNSLTTFINESFTEDHEAIMKLDPKMQDVAKLKQLIKLWDNFGNEVKGDYDRYDNNFERVKEMCSNMTTKNAWAKVEDMFREARKAKGEEKFKLYSKYFDKLFSIVANSTKKEYKNRRYFDTYAATSCLTGIAGYLEDRPSILGGEEDRDKYLGKLITKFEKVFATDMRDAISISKMYDKKYISIKTAIDEEENTIKSIQDIKDVFKEHKYLIVAAATDANAEAFIIDTSKFDSFDESIENVTKQYNKNATNVNVNYVNKQLRSLVETKKTKALFLCDGFYHFGDDKEDIIPYVGYYDKELSTDIEINKYSTYYNKDFFEGYLLDRNISNTYNGFFYYFDSLWTSHKRKGE